MRKYLLLSLLAAAFVCPSAFTQEDSGTGATITNSVSQRAEPTLPRFEIGPTAFFIYREEILSTQEHDFGFGVRFTYNAFSHLSFEAEYDRTPYESEQATPVVGGPLDAAFFGIKSGVRWRKWGLFGKFRPGLLSYNSATKSITGTALGGNVFTDLVIHTGRFTEPAFDTSGGFELYVSRHVLVRYDFGEMIVHHGAFTFPDPLGSVVIGPSTSSDFSFSTGLAFRF